MKHPSDREQAAILALDGAARHDHFVKTICDWEEVWALENEGWALAGEADGPDAFALWPARAYAELCAREAWADFIPVALPLEELMSALLPQLARDGLLVAVFPTPGSRAPLVDPLDLRDRIDAALEEYR